MKKFLAIVLAATALGFAGGVWAQAAATAPAAATAAPEAAAAPAAAEAAPAAAAEAAPAAPTVNKGDNAWLFVATAMVILMSIPGLALFYGGLVRTKNMLSVLMQLSLADSTRSCSRESRRIQWQPRLPREWRYPNSSTSPSRVRLRRLLAD